MEGLGKEKIIKGKDKNITLYDVMGETSISCCVASRNYIEFPVWFDIDDLYAELTTKEKTSINLEYSDSWGDAVEVTITKENSVISINGKRYNEMYENDEKEISFSMDMDV